MATSEPAAVGIAHPTVVPANFDATVTDSTSTGADSASDDASRSSLGRGPREQ